MERNIPLLYRNRFVRILIANLVSGFKLKKDWHKKFMKDLEECYPICSYNLSKKEKEFFYKDFLDAAMKYGVTEVDYFTYEYYLLSDYGRSMYLTERDRGFFHRSVNEKKYWPIMSDKEQFYNKYRKYISRKIMHVTSVSQYKDFFKLCEDVGEIIVKPINGEKGRGIHKLYVRNEKEINVAWRECLDNNLLVEEVIKQSDKIASFNSPSINTIRIATAIDKKGIPHIMAAVIRVGANGSITDNASAGGLFAGIDVNTGIIISKGVDLQAKTYLIHPTTNMPFLGFQIPNWEKLKELALEVAGVMPEMRYIGWDWVLLQNGNWELLEGNEPGGAHVIQQGIGRGLYNDYYNVLMGNESYETK